MKLTDLFDLNELESHIVNGYVTRRVHPFYPLAVLNRTTKATNHHNEITRRCCGLIVDAHDIVGQCLPDAPQNIITVCFYNNNLIVATRESFESDDALWAYEFISNSFFVNFKLLLENDLTAVCVRQEDDLSLAGVLAPDVLSKGQLIWTPASKMQGWPGSRINIERG